jgi:8-oxo-dGTP pyrophosphatase MutT (NUDIX family)
MKKHISSGAIIYNIEDGKVSVLLMYRKLTNTWHLSKGTQNPGETLQETAVREIREETGLDVKLGKYVGKLDSTFERDHALVHKETHYFMARPLGGDMKKHDHEHDEICFVEYSVALSRLENFSFKEKEGKILKMAEPFFA